MDDGQGMATAALRRLFEPFFSTASGERRGTGLGLAVSRAIIESHGGRVEAFSEGPGRGSNFVVTLPIAGNE
jgi:signal transduction histidine kinase